MLLIFGLLSVICCLANVHYLITDNLFFSIEYRVLGIELI